MLWFMGSQRVGHDRVTELKSVNSLLLFLCLFLWRTLRTWGRTWSKEIYIWVPIWESCYLSLETGHEHQEGTYGQNWSTALSI